MYGLSQVRQNYDRSGIFCHKSRVNAFQLSEMIITYTLHGQCSDPKINIYIRHAAPAVLSGQIMYIKKVKKQNAPGKKSYEYLHLVENIRTEKGPRQRLILNLGALDIPQDKYKELANCIEALLTGQKSLFSPDPKITRHAQQAVRNILAKKSTEGSLSIFSSNMVTRYRIH